MPVEMERNWIAVDEYERIVARGETKADVEHRVRDLLQFDLDDYKIVAVPKVDPPQLI